MYSPLGKITNPSPSVLCTPPFEKSPIKTHRFCVLPPLKNHPSPRDNTVTIWRKLNKSTFWEKKSSWSDLKSKNITNHRDTLSSFLQNHRTFRAWSASKLSLLRMWSYTVSGRTWHISSMNTSWYSDGNALPSVADGVRNLIKKVEENSTQNLECELPPPPPPPQWFKLLLRKVKQGLDELVLQHDVGANCFQKTRHLTP